MANAAYLESYVVFPHPPLLDMEEMLLTETNILKARDGSEQRISMRGVPRQAFSTRVSLNDYVDMSIIDAATFGWQKLFWGLPIWSEWTEHLGNISAGANSIAIDTSYADYRADTLAIIWKSETQYETVLISAVNANSLDLTGTVDANWTGTKLIMPCRLAQITDPISSNLVSDQEGLYSFSFMVTDNVRLTGHSPSVLYQGVEVITEPGKIQSGEQGNSDSDSFEQDYRTGGFRYLSDSNYNILSRSYFDRYESRVECWNYRLFLHSLYGRQETVWLPSFRKDMQFNATIGASDTTILIDNIGLVDNVGLNTLRIHVAFLFPNGTQLYREVTGIADSGDNEQITIDSALDVEVAVGGCDISWLDLCRRTNDEVQMIWHHNERCDSRLDYTVVTQ